MKFIAKHIKSLQLLVDGGLIAISWAVAFWIRFRLIEGGQAGLESTFLKWFLPLLGFSFYFALRDDQYSRRRLSTVTDEIMKLIRANALSVVAFIICLYFFSESRISRITIVLYATISTAMLVIGRLGIRSLIRKLRRRGMLIQRVLIAGDSTQVEKYLAAIDYLPSAGLVVDGLFGVDSNIAPTIPHYPLSLLEDRVRDSNPDIIVLGFADEGSTFVSRFIQKHYDQLFQIQVLTSERQALIGLSAEMVDDVHVLTLNEPQFSLPELFAKRALDLFGSGVGLLVLSPLFLLLAVLVRSSSAGPIFFGQERVGVDGTTFKMWKFRTMRVGTLAESKGWTVENDPRRTKIGTFLRRTSLDELPQLWNVFVGQMSLVGPRPEQTHFVEKFRTEIPAYMLRHKMKAGITGWAQISGWRGDTSLHKRIECDLYYIRNWSLWFDLKILFLTFVRGFINKNAY